MKRILVVDDEKLFRWTYREELEREGYVVDTARDGFEALRKVKARRPDCVVTDCLMENMDGAETMERIKEVDRTIPVILCSSCDGLEDHLDNATAFASLVKSPDLSELKHTVAKAMN